MLAAGLLAVLLGATGFASFLHSQFGYQSLHAADRPSFSLIGIRR